MVCEVFWRLTPLIVHCAECRLTPLLAYWSNICTSQPLKCDVTRWRTEWPMAVKAVSERVREWLSDEPPWKLELLFATKNDKCSSKFSHHGNKQINVTFYIAGTKDWCTCACLYVVLPHHPDGAALQSIADGGRWLIVVTNIKKHCATWDRGRLL